MRVDPIGFWGGDLNLYQYAEANPVNYTDSYGLWTFQFGGSFTAGGGVGTTKGLGLILGWNPNTNKFQAGWYSTIGGGAYAGASGSFGLDFTWSENPCIEDVGKKTLTSGGSISSLTGFGFSSEGNIPLNGNVKPSYTFSPTFGAGTPVEGHSFISYTYVQGF